MPGIVAKAFWIIKKNSLSGPGAFFIELDMMAKSNSSKVNSGQSYWLSESGAIQIELSDAVADIAVKISENKLVKRASHFSSKLVATFSPYWSTGIFSIFLCLQYLYAL